jgi:hypothetical protein
VSCGGIVWQVVPQNCGEFVYSQVCIPPASNMSERMPSVAYGRIINQSGVLGQGEKNFLTRSPNFLIVVKSPYVNLRNSRKKPGLLDNYLSPN